MSPTTYRPLPPEPGCESWPAWYRVGDDGSVWSRIRKGCRRINGQPILGPWHRLTPSVLRRRGQRDAWDVTLATDAAGYRRVSVALCVCRAWHGPRPEGCVPFHWPDPDPANCRAENVDWAPHGSVLIGQSVPSRRPGNARLTDDLVIRARMAAAAGRTARDLAAELGIPQSTLALAIRGTTYRDLPGAFTPGSGRRRQS